MAERIQVHEEIEVRQDDLTGPEIVGLLAEHLRCMYEVSPPESVHALDVNKLRQPDVTFWSAWIDGELAGCGALKALGSYHGEVKSMRTTLAHLKKGVATALLKHIITQARQRGYGKLSLETGSMEYFEPAQRLYRKHGFRDCPPFANYKPDPKSVFMTLDLQENEPA